MQGWQELRSRFLLLDKAHIDTDQIIPARFLKQTHKEGLGAALFCDWRYDADGRLRPDEALNFRSDEGLEILVAGPNFGCGSSREHAVWALCDYGFRAVLSPSLSDIFKSNALKNGLLTLEVSADFYQILLAHPHSQLSINLERRLVTVDGRHEFEFQMEGFARTCLMQGLDQLGYLLQHEPAIKRYEEEYCP